MGERDLRGFVLTEEEWDRIYKMKNFLHVSGNSGLALSKFSNYYYLKRHFPYLYMKSLMPNIQHFLVLSPSTTISGISLKTTLMRKIVTRILRLPQEKLLTNSVLIIDAWMTRQHI